MASFSDSRLSNAQFHAHNCHLCPSKQICPCCFKFRSEIYLRISHLYSLALSFLQISLRIFELTNTLKTVFVPTKDNRRLLHNCLAGIAISVCLYFVGFILVQIPHAHVTSNSLFYVIGMKQSGSCHSKCTKVNLLFEKFNLEVTQFTPAGLTNQD